MKTGTDMADQDLIAPTLKSLSFPTRVSLGQASTPVVFSAVAADDSSGIKYVSVFFDRFYSDTRSNGFSSAVTLSGGSGPVDNWSGSISQPFGAASAVGTYRITSVTVTDQVGNASEYSPAQLTTLGIGTEFVVSSAVGVDTTPPILRSLTLPDIDLSNGPVYVTQSVGASDTGSGVARVTVSLRGPTLESTGMLFSGTDDFADDGISSQRTTFATNTAPGRYDVSRVDVVDVAGNISVYYEDDLAKLGASTGFTVTNRSLPVTATITTPSSVREGDQPLALAMALTGGKEGTVNVSVVQDTFSGRTDDLVGPEYDTDYIRASDRSFRLPAVTVVDDLVPEADKLVSVYVTAINQVFGNGTNATTVQFTLVDNDRIGTDAVDLMTGDAGRNYFSGLGGNDSLDGLGGDDSLVGGAGDDRLAGGDGDDVLDGGDGNDLLTGGAGRDTVSGGAGDDVFIDGPGNDVYDGGAGTDRLVLTGNAADYTFRQEAGGDVFLSNNFNDNATVRSSVEQIQFQNGQYLGFQDLGAFIQKTDTTGNDRYVAPLSGAARFDGGAGSDTVVLNGNISDYTLSRALYDGGLERSAARVGDFVLTANNGSGVYTLSESIETIQFQNGQYLSLQHMPAYIAGDPWMALGASQDDRLYQTSPTGYQLFNGNYGNDTLYVAGSAADYAVRSFAAVVPLPSSTAAPGFYTGSFGGLALVAKDGRAELLVDASVETIEFRGGQQIAYTDVTRLLATAPAAPEEVLHFKVDGDESRSVRIDGTEEADRLLLDGNVADYTLSRPDGSTFSLALDASEIAGSAYRYETVDIATSIETVRFADGQYLSINDLSAFVKGSATTTTGTPLDDILVTPRGGNQYLNGGEGVDAAYLQGNVHDFNIRTVTGVADGHGGRITGFELVADNGSGNIFIDASTEVVHFQNSQYLSVGDLNAYIDPFLSV